MSTKIYPPGVILLLEEGEYSDFGYCAQLVTLTEVDLKKEAQKFKDQFQKKDDWDSPSPSSFCAWLCSTQKCAALTCETAHIGNYGELEIEL